MDAEITPYSVRQCSECPGDTAYHCVSCPCDLCPQCKENHVKDLKTIDHDVVSHRDKINYIPAQEICVRHPSKFYKMYCELCELPFCYHCRKHREHKISDLREPYLNKRQQYSEKIHTIRSEALFYRPFLLTGIKADVKTCHKEFSLYQSEMLSKAQRLKDLTNFVLNDLMVNVFCDFDLKHRCLKQKIEVSRNIVCLERYVHIYEQKGVIRPLQFLSSVKTALPLIHLTHHISQLSMTESLNKEDVMESLSAIQITERGNRRLRNERLLKLMSGAEFHESLTITDVSRCYHISIVTSDLFWVSDVDNKLILSNTAGDIIYKSNDVCAGDDDYGNGSHTVNNESELIYINRNYDINKLSKDRTTTTTFIERTDSIWKPRCVYWSPSTGDLLVGMYNDDTGKVTRYNQSGQLTQTLQYDSIGLPLYCEPCLITENNNGDVVVSDNAYEFGAVVVTERGGRHRFSYGRHLFSFTEYLIDPTLEPHGICTDALSHILVCDNYTNTVHMLDKDGQFLLFLLVRPSVTYASWAMSYDVNTHLLWVGSLSNKVCIYRYISRQESQDTLTGLKPANDVVINSLNKTSNTDTEKPKERNELLLKLLFPPISSHVFPLCGFQCYNHISCVKPDRVWVSGFSNDLFLINTEGDILQRLDSSCYSNIHSGSGTHTVNSESELIYIESNHNVNKLSKDMKTITTLIQTTDSIWVPLSVYCSPYSGNLLVALYNYDIQAGKVIKYNRTGQQTRTIQHDSKGQRMYNLPIYITENNNGDVVVSDWVLRDESGAIVVTNWEGKHRFSYTGHPSKSGLEPRGIGTDALSHILVCDQRTDTVQILDKDGQFLLHILEKEIFEPWSLSYDVNSHRLWVGSRGENEIYVYSYFDLQDSQTDTEFPKQSDRHNERRVRQHKRRDRRQKVLAESESSTSSDSNEATDCSGGYALPSSSALF
nr:uncharacterized protein LOC117687782 isoform X2 [Crassostrea gigas]